ncbi:MAG: hemerythrin domain-containing protein [Anaerolineales bacterium]|nr:hemerythrin domain-containing protein [Anaerolineales bacterium]
MNATRVLMEEHRVIERVLGALEKAAGQLKSGRQVRASFFLEAADFIKHYADGAHHMKEEGVLFIAMKESGVPVQGGPIGVMLAEHEQGRQFTHRMREAALRLEQGDEAALDQIIQNALGYAALLRQHIYKEDNILFPMAERVIPGAEQGQVNRDFEKIGQQETSAGVHTKYLALASALEAEAVGL